MSSSIQTILALGIVLIAAAWLLRSTLRKRKNPGCGDNCAAVSPEVKKLQARLKR